MSKKLVLAGVAAGFIVAFPKLNDSWLRRRISADIRDYPDLSEMPAKRFHTHYSEVSEYNRACFEDGQIPPDTWVSRQLECRQLAKEKPELLAI